MTPIQTAFIALAVGTSSVILAFLLIRGWDRLVRGRAAQVTSSLLEPALRPMVFLFRERMLIDATPPARALLDSITGTSDEWTRLTGWIAARIPEAGKALADPEFAQQIDLRGESGSGSAALRLLVEGVGGGLTRLTLTDPTAEHAGIVIDSLVLQAMEDELDLLRRSMDQTPMLVWRLDEDDRITWANAAYLHQAEAVEDDAVAWPLPRLLDIVRSRPGAAPSAQRAQLNLKGSVRWYDCHSHKSGDQTMIFALPADAAVRAERSLREFVQTLTKTFADLPTGLAIFDRDRKLQLFNPSLIDLTRLSAGFLTARPTLFDFLDQLREARMVPEPKDYRSWRLQMNNLENAAATGRHVETWSLPGGQTYRVTGRPHPDGAVAFLFEDITSEISLSRKFRSEISLGAAILDGLEDGIAAFGANNELKSCNKAYEALWGGKPATLTGAIDSWKEGGMSGPGFQALCGHLTDSTTEPRDHGAMIGPQGQLLSWAVTNLGGGRRMVRFGLPPAVEVEKPDDQLSASAAQSPENGRTGTRSASKAATG